MRITRHNPYIDHILTNSYLFQHSLCSSHPLCHPETATQHDLSNSLLQVIFLTPILNPNFFWYRYPWCHLFPPSLLHWIPPKAASLQICCPQCSFFCPILQIIFHGTLSWSGSFRETDWGCSWHLAVGSISDCASQDMCDIEEAE